MDEIISRDDVLLDKLEDQSNRLKHIEKTMAAIAVQNEKIAALQAAQARLWDKYDKLVAPDGIIAKVHTFQGACPREFINKTVARQWATIGLLASLVCGTLLKAIGAF